MGSLKESLTFCNSLQNFTSFNTIFKTFLNVSPSYLDFFFFNNGRCLKGLQVLKLKKENKRSCWDLSGHSLTPNDT